MNDGMEMNTMRDHTDQGNNNSADHANEANPSAPPSRVLAKKQKSWPLATIWTTYISVSVPFHTCRDHYGKPNARITCHKNREVRPKERRKN